MSLSICERFYPVLTDFQIFIFTFEPSGAERHIFTPKSNFEIFRYYICYGRSGVKFLDFRKITIFRWSTYCSFVNTVLNYIKISTSVEWNCSNNLSKYWNTSTCFKHFTSTSNIWKSSKINFFEKTVVDRGSYKAPGPH